MVGLIENIIKNYGDHKGNPEVKGVTVEDAGGDNESLAAQPGSGRGGSHQGMAKSKDVLAGTELLTEQHFVAKLVNNGICVLCYHCQPDKQGQKQIVTFCKEYKVMLHVPECSEDDTLRSVLNLCSLKYTLLENITVWVCLELEDGGGAVNLGCQDIFGQAIWKGGRARERIDVLSNGLESRAKQD